ncbi:hypothetical protein MXB_4536 [Myxobolus squamalis]|nr:hypothetical protein MXB_4536 [Myxobolus squamalis]
MAPEIANKSLQYLEVDIWSIGCLVIEMIEGIPPLFMYSHDEALQKLQALDVTEIFPTKIHPKFSAFARPFLDCCLVIKRNIRASASQLLIHPFLMTRSTPQDLVELMKSGTALL